MSFLFFMRYNYFIILSSPSFHLNIFEANDVESLKISWEKSSANENLSEMLEFYISISFIWSKLNLLSF